MEGRKETCLPENVEFGTFSQFRKWRLLKSFRRSLQYAISFTRLPVDSRWFGIWEQVEVQYLLSRAGFHHLRTWTSELVEHVSDKKVQDRGNHTSLRWSNLCLFIQTELKAFWKSMEITALFCLFLLTSWLHTFSRYNILTVLRCDWKSSCSASIALVILKKQRTR